jgi:hypothetical protein
MRFVRRLIISGPAMQAQLMGGLVGLDELAGAPAGFRVCHPRDAAIGAKPAWLG